jgi:hypothetical protein
MTKDKKTENLENTTEPIIKQKRGRKSKKDIQLANEQKLSQELLSKTETNTETSIPSSDNITCSIQEITEICEIGETCEIDDSNDEPIQKPGAKKRGRKPKGGKIIQQTVHLNNNKDLKPNIILHLKCSLKDLQTNTLLSSNVESFNFSDSKGDLSYEVINSSDTLFIKNSYLDISNENFNSTNTNTNTNSNSNNNNKNQQQCYDDDDETSFNKDSDTKEIWKKLKQLEHNLHINNISDKKSACFWCTYEFDNPPVYIPKHLIKNSYQVYGCFCSPECSTAYLMEENIDSSIKFERYHLINHIYSQIYDYKKNIKPAPNPYYMLEKYYGNLNIQEYRSLLRNDRLFLIVDKPLTRILPELHEDNDDFIINNKIIPSNTYQIKKKLQRKIQNQNQPQNKNNIFNEKFSV